MMFDGPPRGFVVSTDSNWRRFKKKHKVPAIWLYTTTLEKHVGSSHAHTTQFNLILKHLWLMMEVHHASPMTRMTLLGLPRQSQKS